MKRSIALFLAASLIVVAELSAQVTTPQPSPAGTVTTVVGLTDVKIEYFRPRAKGRKIFGDGAEFVVPYGKMWRTGANSGTRITFSDEVKLGGIPVPKGTYQLLTTPGASEWTIALHKEMVGGDLSKYKPENDQANFKVKSEKSAAKVEMLTYQITDLSDDSKNANIQLSWENTVVNIPMSVDFDAKVMKSIEASTKVSPGNLYQAAQYYYDTGKDLKQALEWVTTAAAANPDQYWVVHLKAQIQKGLGDKKGALESANASKAAAEKSKDDAYIKRNNELIASLK
jgi:hypothetical protein